MAGQRNKKEEDTSYRDFRRAMEKGEVGNLYFFHGEEDFLRDHWVGEMKKRLLTGGLDDFNCHILSGKDMSLRRLHEAVDALPMMSEHTLVLVNDYDLGKGNQDELAQLLDDLPDYVCLIFVFDTVAFKADNRTKLGKVIREKGTVVNFVRQDQKDLTGWIARHFKSLGHEISGADAQYLIFLCGDLMTNLLSEIGKIGAYAKETRITRQDIDAVASPQLSAVVFDMTDAISAGNYDKAFSVLSVLFDLQEPPIKTLAAVGKNLRQLYAARLAVEKGKSPQDLMKLCEIRFSFLAEKLMRSAKRFSLSWCRRAVRLCEEADVRMKSTGDDGEEILTELLLALSEKDAG